ncbi:MAG TPA: cellulase family glycosylhydrolase [Ktedonobacteraceae bacterium]
MLRICKTAFLSLCVLAIVAIGIFKFFQPPTVGATIASSPHVSKPSTLAARVTATTTATASKPVTDSAPVSRQGQGTSRNSQPIVAKKQATGYAFADGPYTVQGNAIIGADGKRYLFHGVGRDSLEYNCWGDGHFDAQELAYMGSGSGKYAVTYWGANTVRLPLSEGIWLNGQSSEGCSAAQYQALINSTVNSLTALKLNVILDLQWSDAGGQSLQAGGPWAVPDADSVTFWQQVATMYKSYSNVLFELFNEPHPGTWTCWLSTCVTTDTSYSQDCNCNKTVTFNSVGMQALVNAVRGTGASNLVIVAGMDWGYDLSQIAKYSIQGANVIYDTHPYPYAEKQPNTWDAAFGTISKTYPVISAESGEYDCGTAFMSQLLAYFDAHQISWVGWAWVMQGSQCGYPLLIRDYRGTPTVGMGQLIYQRLQSYLK